jgi:hypothetical protein
MPRPPSKRGPGRPALGPKALGKVVPVRLSELEYAAIAKAVAKLNTAAGEDAKQATVSSWIREHALAPLGLVPAPGSTR